MELERDGYKIQLEYIPSFGPYRGNDWEATKAEYEEPIWDGDILVNKPPVGFGPTAEEAIADLLRKLKDRDGVRSVSPSEIG